MSARRRRGLERSESLPEPPAPPPPKPLPEPAWKRELQEKLAGYRGVQRPPSADYDPSKRDLPPLAQTIRTEEQREEPLPPPRRSVPAEPSTVAEAAPPPIVDLRPTSESASGHGATPAPAALSVRAIAGAMDLGVALLATGLFTGVLYQLEQVALSPEETARIVSVAFVLNLCFYLLSFLLYAGRTAGMSWLGLSVLNLDGEPPRHSQRRSRAFGTLLSLAALGIGFAWAAADEQGLTWHDRISKTFISQDDV